VATTSNRSVNRLVKVFPKIVQNIYSIDFVHGSGFAAIPLYYSSLLFFRGIRVILVG